MAAPKELSCIYLDCLQADTQEDLEKTLSVVDVLRPDVQILIVKCGNNDRPASSDDMNDVRRALDEFFKQNKLSIPFLVTSHAMDFSVLNLKTMKIQKPLSVRPPRSRSKSI